VAGEYSSSSYIIDGGILLLYKGLENIPRLPILQTANITVLLYKGLGNIPPLPILQTGENYSCIRGWRIFSYSYIVGRGELLRYFRVGNILPHKICRLWNTLLLVL
jgi:hypothetical protein